MSRLTCIFYLNVLWMVHCGAMNINFGSFIQIMNASFHQFLPNYLHSYRWMSSVGFCKCLLLLLAWHYS